MFKEILEKAINESINEGKKRYIIMKWVDASGYPLGTYNIVTTKTDSYLMKSKREYPDASKLELMEISKKKAQTDYKFDEWFDDNNRPVSGLSFDKHKKPKQGKGYMEVFRDNELVYSSKDKNDIYQYVTSYAFAGFVIRDSEGHDITTNFLSQ